MQLIPHAAFLCRYRTLGVSSSDITLNVDSGHRGTGRRLKVYIRNKGGEGRGGEGGSVKLHVCKAKESTTVGMSTGWYFCTTLMA